MLPVEAEHRSRMGAGRHSPACGRQQQAIWRADEDRALRRPELACPLPGHVSMRAARMVGALGALPARILPVGYDTAAAWLLPCSQAEDPNW